MPLHAVAVAGAAVLLLVFGALTVSRFRPLWLWLFGACALALQVLDGRVVPREAASPR